MPLRLRHLIAMLAAAALVGPAPAASTPQPLQTQLVLLPAAEAVGRYQRIEFRIDAPAPVGNPYDPEQIDVSVEFTAPSGQRLLLPAFWYQDYERRPTPQRGDLNNWLYPIVPAGACTTRSIRSCSTRSSRPASARAST